MTARRKCPVVHRLFSINNSLRSRLILLVALAILPSALMIAYFGWQERQSSMRASEQSLQRLTSLAALNEARLLESGQSLLNTLSNLPGLLGTQQECARLLQAILGKNPNYIAFALASPNGDVSCSSNYPENPYTNIADRYHFRAALEEKRFVAGNFVIGRLSKKPSVNLAYPILQEGGAVRAVLIASLDLLALDEFADDIDLPPDSVLITTDAEGTIISRRPHPEQRLGKPVSAPIRQAMQREEMTPVVLKGSDGIERLHAFSRVGDARLSNYLLTIGIPNESVIASAAQYQIMALIGLLLTTLLSLFLTRVAGNLLIVKRIRALVDTAQELSSGNLQARTGLDYGNGKEEIAYLARALDEMAASLQKQREQSDRVAAELREADRHKDEFLAMLAHELRNPLAPISSAAELLKLVGDDPEQVRRISEVLARQVEHMTGLVDDLLDMSRVTRGLIVIAREPVTLQAILQGAIEQTQPLVTEREHQLTLCMPEETVYLEADKARLIQVVVNLLNNAAKFTPPGGTLHLNASAGPQEVVIAVQDNGMGISPGLLPSVFQLFRQSERRPDRAQGGLGLGLALVKSLVELHGGQVSAHSPGPGQGACFTIRLPRSFPAELPAPPEPLAASLPVAAAGLRILVVDDNADVATSIASLLQALGHLVDTAFDPHEALARSQQETYDVFLLDIGLPHMNGYELAQRLRAQAATAQACLIALTGYGSAEDRLRTATAGFDQHLVKPANSAVLARLLEDIGRHKEARKTKG